MELRNLKTFQTAAEFLNFTKAAEHLNFTQPTVTAQIQSLEQELNQQLFMRVGKKTYLTPAGKMLRKYTDQLFVIIEEIESSFAELGTPHGSLKIAAPEIYCTNYFPSLISEYLKTYPDVQVKLISCNSNEVMKGIETDLYDIGIIAGEVSKSGIKNIFLEEEDLILVVSKRLYETYSTEQLLTEFPFIKYRIDGNFDALAKKYLHNSKFYPKKIIEFGSEEAIKRAVLNQTGIALLASNLVKKEIMNNELVPIRLTEENFTFKTSLIVLEEKANLVTFKSFCDVLQSLWSKSHKLE
ncbi:LysR family transcriptional regulator [Pseudobacillus wudalianchiensis]|uniref:LysR family transcriptional regulator n=1 Tax=Pseudobacillus wudalianchiensis TaxID=1743143 RepID=A0A1B9ADZ4_9BACI|nr:LysR family transcriptional regulator [Bacillus wudalianchiensis]OCA82073.1 LysR family transcriptional regulator [Bacillus wudalianchiensis]